MSTHDGQLQAMLTQLGRAHKEGAFQSEAAGYPWEAMESEVIRLPNHRFAWFRVAGPIAAAAAVAVLFIGPLFNSPSTVKVAEGTREIAIPDQSKPVVVADSEPTTGAVERDSCDFNGDGVVDGADIQPFMDQALQGYEKDPAKTAIFLQCLLRMPHSD